MRLLAINNDIPRLETMFHTLWDRWKGAYFLKRVSLTGYLSLLAHFSYSPSLFLFISLSLTPHCISAFFPYLLWFILGIHMLKQMLDALGFSRGTQQKMLHALVTFSFLWGAVIQLWE